MSRSLIYMDNLHGWTGYTGLFDESFHRLEKEVNEILGAETMRTHCNS